MSQVKMPEPVAEIRHEANITIFDITAEGKSLCLTVGSKFITTDQAEAYANERVREALEAAAKQVWEIRERVGGGMPVKYAQHERNVVLPYLNVAEDRIRALIPLENKA